MTKEVGPASETVTQENVSKELQVRMSLAQILEKQRSVAVETVVREQFESDLKGLTDAEQDSKDAQVGQAPPALRADHRHGQPAVPGRSRDGRR